MIKKNKIQNYLLLIFLFTPLCVSAGEPTLPKAPYILSETVKRWQADGREVVFVDVREKGEFDTGHMPGAINIPYSEIESRSNEFKSANPYIIYCIYSSWRAPYAANVLADLGHKNVFVLEGGIAAWHAGGQVILPTTQDSDSNTKGQIAPYPQNLNKDLKHPPDAKYPQKVKLTLAELANYDGKDGRPAYVAVDGIIYDLTQSRLWRGGDHDPSHGKALAGRDLTEVLKDSPHGKIHLQHFPVVGTLE